MAQHLTRFVCDDDMIVFLQGDNDFTCGVDVDELRLGVLGRHLGQAGHVDLDKAGTDSFAHRSAGAQEVMLASDKRYAILKEFHEGTAPKLSDLLQRMDAVDLVIVEGFKSEAHPKIECHRAGCEMPLIADSNDTVKLIATNEVLDTPLPQLDMNRIDDIADFVMLRTGLTANPN